MNPSWTLNSGSSIQEKTSPVAPRSLAAVAVAVVAVVDVVVVALLATWQYVWVLPAGTPG